MTTVMVAPPRQAALLAKQAATLDHVAEGPFRLDMGVGGRPDGYAVLGRDLDHRDRQLDELLDALERRWPGEALPGADRPIGAPPLTEGPAHRARWHLGGGAERDGQPVIRGAW